MQFHIDIDNGEYITGWVLPDNPSATPVVVAAIPGRSPVEISAHVFRKDLKDLGIHHTGMLGFEVTRHQIPELDVSSNIEIREAETGLLVHRRFQDGAHLRFKALFYDPSAMPQMNINAHYTQHFTLCYPAVERFSYDTMFGIINNASTPSVCLVGRPNLLRYQQLLKDRNYKVFVILPNPIEELAEKLAFLKFVSTGRAAPAVLDHLAGLSPLIELAARLDFSDENSLTSTLSTLSDLEREALSNPIVRFLGCAQEEIAQDMHVSIALENLANVELVGTREKFELFRAELQAILGADILGIEEPARITSVAATAQKLEKLRSVHQLLALDLKLYRFVSEAISSVYAPNTVVQPR